MVLYSWLVAAGFGMYETAHYGWNWSAKLDAEMICDGITAILCGLAVIATVIRERS